jgi:hypothetical protein
MNRTALTKHRPQNLRHLSDHDLILKVESLVRQERQLIEDLIWHLQEIQDRKLYISMGYSSLFECLVKRFAYSEAVAYTRISALRIMTAVPEAAKALSDGEVTLTTLSLTQSFIRKQEKESGHKLSIETKEQYLAAIKNKSTQEVKQTLARLNPAQELPIDKVIYLTESDVQLQITTDINLLKKIETVKALISHENIDPTYNELLHMAFDAVLEKKEKAKGFRKMKSLAIAPTTTEKMTQGNSVKSESSENENSRYIRREVKRHVLERANQACEYTHPNGKKCGSRFQLQFDHIQAFCKGGTSDLKNIQVLCRVHNSYKSDS